MFISFHFGELYTFVHSSSQSVWSQPCTPFKPYGSVRKIALCIDSSLAWYGSFYYTGQLSNQTEKGEAEFGVDEQRKR